MAKKKRSKKNTDELNTENDFLKLKMMAEFGGNFMGSESIPPEVENQFLKQIMQFHKLQENTQLTTIYKFIGEPEYNHVHDLSDKEVKRELKKLLRLLTKNGIGLDVLAPTPEREIYRFVTEELFKQEISDVRVKGWVSQFVYEEFHPNAEYDIKNTVHQVLLSLFDSQAHFMEDLFAEEFKDHLGLSMEVEELRHRAEDFRNQYADVILTGYDCLKIQIDSQNGTAYVNCDVTYKTQKTKGRRTARHLTQIEMYFTRHEHIPGMWQLSRLVTSLW